MLLGTMHIPDKDHYNPSETQLSSAIYRPFHDNSTYNDRDPKNPPNWLLGQDTKGGKTRNAHGSRGMKEHSLRETNADQNGCTWIFLLCVKFVPFHPENLQKGKSFTYIWKIQVYLITIYIVTTARKTKMDTHIFYKPSFLGIYSSNFFVSSFLFRPISFHHQHHRLKTHPFRWCFSNQVSPVTRVAPARRFMMEANAARSLFFWWVTGKKSENYP